MEFIVSLLGLARAIPSLHDYYKKIKAKINFPSIYEDTLYRSMQSAVKEVTGLEISNFDINEKIEIYEAALLFFDDPAYNANRLEQLFYSSNPKIKEIENRFLFNLIKNGGIEIVIYLLTQILPKVDRIEAGVNRNEEGLSLANLRLKEIQSLTKDIPKFINDLDKLFQPQLAQSVDKFKLDDTIAFFEAPLIPDNFIKRKETITILKKKFDKQIIVIHGVTRSGKSFLVSELVRDEKLDYLWYDFKLNETNGDNFFYLQLAKYIIANNPEAEIGMFTDEINFNFQTITEALKTKAFSLSGLFIILDNIQLSGHIEQLDSFLKLLTEKSGGNIFVILISEDRDIYQSFSSNIQNINEFQNTGFSVNEINEFFEANGISTEKASVKFLEMIHYNSNGGHPDIINGLTLELKNKNVKSLLSAEVVNQVLNSFKDLPAHQKITTVVSDKIFTNILKSEDEKNMFIRLSCLIGIFTRDLAYAVLLIKPSISSYHLIFPPISEKLFDVYPDSKYSIPRIFKITSEKYLTDKIKNEVYITAAAFLSTPQKGILNFNDGELACLYLLSAGQTNAAITLASELLRRVIIKYDEEQLIRDGLLKLGIYINLPTKEQYINEHIDLLIIAFEAHKKLNDIKEGIETSEKLFAAINMPRVEPKLKHIASSSILFFYIQNHVTNSEILINCSLYFLEGLEKEFIPYELVEKIDKNAFLKGLLLHFLIQDVPDIKGFNKILISCIERNINIGDIYDSESVVDSFNVLWSILYKNINSSSKVSESLLGISIDLVVTKQIFIDIKFRIGQREINYLLGLLYTDLADNPLEAIQYFKEALSDNEELQTDDKIFLSKNYLGLGDAYYRAKHYKLALENYLLSEGLFKDIDDEDLLIVHNLTREGICNYELGNKEKSEEYFWKAFKYSHMMKEKNIDLIFLTLAEMSTFYIKNEEYLKSIKCFSIILGLLDRIEYSGKHQLVAHTLVWLRLSKLNTPDSPDRFNLDEKDYIKPFWGMYNNAAYIDPNATKLTTLYMLAEVLNGFGQHQKADRVFKKIIESSDCSIWDSSAKYLSVTNLINSSIKKNNFNNLLYCFEQFIPILNNLSTTPEFPTKDVSGALRTFFIMPVHDKYIKKYDTIDEFLRVEKLFITLIELLKKFTYDFIDNVFAQISSAFGWLYGLNTHLDKSYHRISLQWLSVSNDKALANNMFEVYVNNKNIELFHKPKIMDLKKYLNDVFEYIFEVKNWFDKNEIINSLLISYKNYISIIQNPDATSEDLRILDTVKDSLKFVGPNSDIKNNFIFSIVGLLKIRLIINYDKRKVFSSYKFLLEHLESVHKTELDQIIENYFSVHNDLIRKNISNDSFVAALNKDLRENLILFTTNKMSIIPADLYVKIENKINELM